MVEVSPEVWGEIIVEQDNWPHQITSAFERGKSIEREPQCDISAIREVPMRECLAIHGDFSFAKLPIEHTIENIGNLLGVPRLAILVPVADFFCCGLVEEQCNKAGYNWQVLKLLSWLPTFVVSRFVAVGERATI